MKNSSLYLPGFHLSTLRRKPRSLPQKLADGLAKIRHHSISSLGECFGQFIPSNALENGEAGSFSRRRVFSKTNTFWAFFSQVLDADGGCLEVVHKPTVPPISLIFIIDVGMLNCSSAISKPPWVWIS